MNSRVLKKSAIYLIGNFSSKILMAIIIPIYAFYVQSSDLGYFDYSQTMMSIVIPIVFFSVWEAILKFTIDDKYPKSEIINSAIVLSIGACLVIAAGLFVVSIFVDIQYFLYILLMFILYGLVQIWQYAARGLDNSKIYVISGVVGTVVNFGVIFALVVGCRLGLQGLLISYILSQIATFITIEIKLRLFKTVRLRRDSFRLLGKMVKFSAPLTLNTISAWLFTGFSRVIINGKLGDYENGLYAFANKFAIVISMLGSVITMAVIEEAILSRKEKKADAAEGKNTGELYVALIGIATVAVPAIRLFYIFIAESEYYSSFMYVPFLLLYAAISTLASNIGAQFQALEITKYQFISTIIGSVFTVVLSILFIGKYGIMAVVLAQAIGALVMAVARYIIVKRYMSYRMDLLKMLITTVIYVALSVLCIYVSVEIVFAVLAVAVVYSFAINRKLIFSFLRRKPANALEDQSEP